MSELAQVYGIDVPRNKCESCGYWYVTKYPEQRGPYLCCDCADDAEPEKPRNSFDAFLSRCVSDCVNGRR